MKSSRNRVATDDGCITMPLILKYLKCKFYGIYILAQFLSEKVIDYVMQNY